MKKTRQLRTLACAALLPGLAAAGEADRASVSKSLEQRMGHGVRPAATTENARKSSFPPGLRERAELTEDDAVAIALWNNGPLQAALETLGLAEADLIEAGLLRNPNLQMLLPVGPKPFEMLIQAPLEALWQRPRRVAVAKLHVASVGESLVQAGLDTARDARLAHAGLALATQRFEVGTAAHELAARIAALTEKRLAAGDISEFEANLTRIEARSLRDAALRYERDADAARERLRLVLGLRGTALTLRAVTEGPEAAGPPPLDKLVEEALAARPDLRAAELEVELAMARARWERSRIFALIGPMLSVKGVGSPTAIRRGPGILADLPVFHRNQGQIARADADVERTAMAYLAARDRVELEVREGRVLLIQELESLERIRTGIVPSVQKSIQLAEKAYRDGDASYLTVLEAQRQIYAVRLREAEAAAGVRRALAQLERGVGKKL